MTELTGRLVIRVPLGEDKEQAHEFSKKEWGIIDKERRERWNVVENEFCAYLNGKVVGTARFEIIGGAAYLEDFIVSDSARRLGVGNALLKKFEMYAKGMGCHVACTETSSNLPHGIKFYEKNGYRTEARLQNNRFHRGVLFMTKRLSR